MNIRQRTEDIVEHIKQGKVLEAFEKHYADDCVMQENRNDPVHGKDSNREREKQFLASVKEWKGFEVIALGADSDTDDGTTFLEVAFDFINQQDQHVRYEQVAVQTWKNGKIVSERFYYDTAA
jgi:ketosteroid isomerase-like protein